MKNFFYIKQRGDKDIFFKMNLQDIIMVEGSIDGCSIKRMGTPSINVKGTIAELFQKYFKNSESFIRSSPSHIVNVDYIETVEMGKHVAFLKLADRQTASLRLTHPYAGFILEARFEKSKFKPASKLQVNNSAAVDKIIMGSETDIKKIIERIKQEAGQVVTSRYITKRYRELTNDSESEL
jgi:hypothetical protein